MVSLLDLPIPMLGMSLCYYCVLGFDEVSISSRLPAVLILSSPLLSEEEITSLLSILSSEEDRSTLGDEDWCWVSLVSSTIFVYLLSSFGGGCMAGW